MNRVRLTKEEALWYSRSVLKSIINAEAKAKKDPKILERQTYKGLMKMKQSAEEAAQLEKVEIEYMDITLSPKCKIIIKGIADTLALSLEQNVIPTYVKRGLTKYEQRAKDKLEFLRTLARKFK